MSKVETLTLPGVPRKRGRPSGGKALSPAERQRNYRCRNGVKSVTIQLSVDVHEKLDEYVRFRNISKAAVIEKLLVSQLFRKR